MMQPVFPIFFSSWWGNPNLKGGGEKKKRNGCRNYSQATVREIPPLLVSEHSCVFTRAFQQIRCRYFRWGDTPVSSSTPAEGNCFFVFCFFFIIHQETSSGWHTYINTHAAVALHVCFLSKLRLPFAKTELCLATCDLMGAFFNVH